MLYICSSLILKSNQIGDNYYSKCSSCTGGESFLNQDLDKKDLDNMFKGIERRDWGIGIFEGKMKSLRIRGKKGNRNGNEKLTM